MFKKSGMLSLSLWYTLLYSCRCFFTSPQAFGKRLLERNSSNNGPRPKCHGVKVTRGRGHLHTENHVEGLWRGITVSTIKLVSSLSHALSCLVHLLYLFVVLLKYNLA